MCCTMVSITWKNLGHEKNIFLLAIKIKPVLSDVAMVFRFLEIISNFIEACKKFTIKDHNSKLFKIFENHQRPYKKFCFVFYKVSSRDTIPVRLSQWKVKFLFLFSYALEAVRENLNH